MATHSSILAWKIPRTEEPGRLQSMRSQGVRHDLVTKASLVAQMVKNLPAMWETRVQSLGSGGYAGDGNGHPLQYSYLENPMERGAWWATVHGVTKELDMTE